MNGRLAKAIRKFSRRNWQEYFNEIKTWPLGVRLRFAREVIQPRRGLEILIIIVCLIAIVGGLIYFGMIVERSEVLLVLF